MAENHANHANQEAPDQPADRVEPLASLESVEDALDWMRWSFRPEAAESVQATYQLELTGDPKRVVWARIDGGRLSVGDGTTPSPDVVFRLDAEDFFGLLAGRENPDLLYMEDRISVTGSLSLALKLRVIFAVSRSI